MKRKLVILISIMFSLSGAQIKRNDASLWQAINSHAYEEVKRLVAEGAPYRDVVKALMRECKEEEKILSCPVPNMKLEENTRALQAITQGAQTYMLWKFMRNNNVTEVRKLFAQNKVGDLTISPNGQTPLLWAARHGYLDIAEQCIRRGLPIDAADPEGITPLLRAVQYGHIKMVRLLLAYGADINKQDNDGLTALMWAIYHGHAALAKWFIDNGADIHLKNILGITALSVAVELGRYDIAQLLLSHGAALSELSPENSAKLNKALEKGKGLRYKKSRIPAIAEEKMEEEKRATPCNI